MATGKPSTVNLGLLAVTVLSLLLAAYGMFFAPRGESRSNATRTAASDADFDDPHSAYGNSQRCAVANSGTGTSGNAPQLPPGKTAGDTSTHTKPHGSNGPSSTGPTTPSDVVTSDESGEISGLVLDTARGPVEVTHVVSRPADSREQPKSQRDGQRERVE